MFHANYLPMITAANHRACMCTQSRMLVPSRFWYSLHSTSEFLFVDELRYSLLTNSYEFDNDRSVE